MGSPHLPTSISIFLGTLLGAGAGLVMHYPDWSDGWFSSGQARVAEPVPARSGNKVSSGAPTGRAPHPRAEIAELPEPSATGAPSALADALAPAPQGTEDAGVSRHHQDAFTVLPVFSAFATPEDLSRGTEQCGAGDGNACVRLGLSYSEGIGVKADPTTARRLRQRAIGILVRQCHDVDAAACLTVARLYKDGIGLQPSDASALALIERARLLCRVNPQPACSGISPERSSKD